MAVAMKEEHENEREGASERGREGENDIAHAYCCLLLSHCCAG